MVKACATIRKIRVVGNCLRTDVARVYGHREPSEFFDRCNASALCSWKVHVKVVGRLKLRRQFALQSVFNGVALERTFRPNKAKRRQTNQQGDDSRRICQRQTEGPARQSVSAKTGK